MTTALKEPIDYSSNFRRTQGLGLAIAKRLAREGSPGIVVSDQNVREPAYPQRKGAPQHHSAGLTSLFQAIEMALERK